MTKINNYDTLNSIVIFYFLSLGMKNIDTVQTAIQFEEGYVFSNCRSITSTPDIALTEFVANAWDAGAYNVSIIIPFNETDEISIEDDGVGMNDEEFRQRWMTLSYNRQKRQGKTVIFPDDVDSYMRIAYGRNGIGRHGMFCFSNYYTVETRKDGICNKYDITLSSGNEPFSIANSTSYKKTGHGTKISAYVNRHLPDANAMTEIISARFLYDPKFIVSINGKIVDLLNCKGIFYQKDILLENKIKLHLVIIDSSKTAIKSHQHGIAFWVSGRLVGKPSWTYGNFQFLDGRFKAAKRYTLIVQTDDLIDDVLPDWTGFIDSPSIQQVYSQFKKYVDDFIFSVMSEQVKDTQLSVIEDTRDELELLNPYVQREISAFIENLTTKNPTISPDFLKVAVEAVISIEQANKGEQLLAQLGAMAPEELDKLSELLTNWDINDVLSVLNEIDKRIVAIEAIARLYEDKKTDELHTLHPIVLNSRWLFGSEFDSPMFVSNVALSTVVKSLFKDSDYDLEYISNPRKRPDIVCLKEYTIKAVSTDRIDLEAGCILKPDQILIIELKRGGFEITAEEVSQAENYVRQIRKSSALHKFASIHAFVVGAKIGDVDCHKESSSGIVDVVTYGHLVETANAKLFKLRNQLKEHYESLGNESIVEQALKQPKQMSWKL